MKRRNDRTYGVMLGALLLAAALTGCGGDGGRKPESTADKSTEQQTETAASGGKHTLAASVPLTGSLMQYGLSYKYGIELAVADFNAAGGLNGQDVVISLQDDKGEQKEGINVANFIIDDQDVFAVVGSYGSSVSLAEAPIYQEAQLPMVSPNTSHPDYPGVGNMMMPLSPKSENCFSEVARQIHERFGNVNMALLYQNTDSGITIMTAIKDTFAQLGGTICANEVFVSGETKDFTPLLSKIKQADPQILVIVTEYSDGAAIITQSKQLGMDDVQLVGVGPMFKQELLNIAGTAADGMLLIGNSRIYTEEVLKSGGYDDYCNDVVRRYNELHKDENILFDNFAGMAYDGAMLAMTAAKEAGTDDPVALVEAMKKFPVPLTTGDAYFDENGELFRTVFAYGVKDATFVLADDPKAK